MACMDLGQLKQTWSGADAWAVFVERKKQSKLKPEASAKTKLCSAWDPLIHP